MADHKMSTQLNMFPFLCLPRELRDRVYDECLIAPKPINLQNLAPYPHAPVPQRLCLIPNLLASCRQVYEEGVVKLYEGNLYFVDLTSPWRFSQSMQRRGLSESHALPLDICLVCQRTDPGGMTSTDRSLLKSWNPNLGRVRRLQASLQQYTYSQWKYRQPPAFPRVPQTCLHVPYMALQEQLQLDLLIIRISEHSLLSVEDSRRLSCWYAVSQGYSSRDIDSWKAEGGQDLKRLVKDVLRFAAQRPSNIVISRPGRSPTILTNTTTIPQYILSFSRTGQYFGGEAICDRKRLISEESLEGFHKVSEKTSTLARISGSRVICLGGDKIAFTSI